MCGIVGILNFNHESAGREAVQAALNTITHRGPDGEGIYVKGPMALGHRRLSIIDLSAAGRQPMSNEDGTVWLTFNGEIYNYLELIPGLKARGHVFKSKTDAEVIIHAYEEWGVDCFSRFNGMWGLAIWDEKRRRLVLSRDRFGVKPLYYQVSGTSVYFASEIKAVLALTGAAPTINAAVLYRFLTKSVAEEPGSSFFEGIKSLAPAHYLEIDSGGLGEARRYWDLDPVLAAETYDYSSAENTFLELLSDSVKLRLRSDVPVGTCLSGGLDSSAIVALAGRENRQPVATFSAVYDDPACDERRFINVVNEAYSTKPSTVRPEGDTLWEVLPRIIWFQDAPTAGPGVYSQWQVMATAQGKVKVLLDGQGGDELLGGYHYYFDYYLKSLLKASLTSNRLYHLKLLFTGWREISALTGRGSGGRLATHFLKDIYQKLADSRWSGALARELTFLNAAARSRYAGLDKEFESLAAPDARKRPARRELGNALDTALYNDLTVDGLPALLRYEDRNSMAFSIEARTPFLDYRLVEFCFGLPMTEKINGGVTKSIMRKALAGILPNEIINRSDKKGYPTPLSAWLRADGCRRAKEILLTPESKGRGIFQAKIIEESLKRQAAGGVDLSWEIWRWLTTEIWFQQFFDTKIAGVRAKGYVYAGN